MYEIKAAGAKGLGVFASSIIPRGTRILAERPLFTIPKDNSIHRNIYYAIRLLSPEARTQFLQLSSHGGTRLSLVRWAQAAFHTTKSALSSLATLKPTDRRRIGTEAHRWTLSENVKTLNIFLANNFDLGDSQGRAIFRNISRINHSCVPNAQGNFNEGLEKFTVHAVREIDKGEELTISYLPEHGATRQSRQERLEDVYGFKCDCPVCDSNSMLSQQSDIRRKKMHEQIARFAESGETNIEQEHRMTEDFIRVLEDDGIVGREVSSM